VGILYSKERPDRDLGLHLRQQGPALDLRNEAELLIAHMAKAIVDAWSPKGLVSEKGK
jgi:hypothetical protein